MYRQYSTCEYSCANKISPTRTKLKHQIIDSDAQPRFQYGFVNHRGTCKADLQEARRLEHPWTWSTCRELAIKACFKLVARKETSKALIGELINALLVVVREAGVSICVGVRKFERCKSLG